MEPVAIQIKISPPPVTIRAAVLQGLFDGERSGLGLIEYVARHSGGMVNLRLAGVYQALRALAVGGLLAWRDSKPERGHHGRPYRLYRLTPGGRKEAVYNRSLITSLFTEAA